MIICLLNYLIKCQIALSNNHTYIKQIFPDIMIITRVIPIYKSSDSGLLKKYRSLSLLTTFSKLIEILMFNKLISFLNSNNILLKHQYGFRSKYSSVHPVIYLLNLINYCDNETNQVNSEFTLGIFCDILKTFDANKHDVLLQKLNYYGIRGVANQCSGGSTGQDSHPSGFRIPKPSLVGILHL